MSPHAVNSFVTDLVAMAQAMERVPVLEADIAEANNTVIRLQDRVTALELSLEASKTYAAGLEQKVHNAEVARDDAEMRFLEADDKAINILAMAKAARASLDQITGLLDPPKPEPIATPTPSIEGQSVVDPIVLIPTTETQVGSTSTVEDTSTSPPTDKLSNLATEYGEGKPSEVTQPQADPTVELQVGNILSSPVASTTNVLPRLGPTPASSTTTSLAISP